MVAGLFLSWTRPSTEQQKSCIESSGDFNCASSFRCSSSSYDETKKKTLTDAGFFINRSRVLLGSGPTTFNLAKSALLNWRSTSQIPGTDFFSNFFLFCWVNYWLFRVLFIIGVECDMIIGGKNVDNIYWNPLKFNLLHSRGSGWVSKLTMSSTPMSLVRFSSGAPIEN